MLRGGLGSQTRERKGRRKAPGYQQTCVFIQPDQTGEMPPVTGSSMGPPAPEGSQGLGEWIAVRPQE